MYSESLFLARARTAAGSSLTWAFASASVREVYILGAGINGSGHDLTHIVNDLSSKSRIFAPAPKHFAEGN